MSQVALLGGNQAQLTAAHLAELKERLNAYTPAGLVGSESDTSSGRFWTATDLAC